MDLLIPRSVSDAGFQYHVIGDDSRGTGYDAIAWIEAAVRNQSFIPPTITVHSANPAARIRMLAGIEAIQ